MNQNKSLIGIEEIPVAEYIQEEFLNAGTIKKVSDNELLNHAFHYANIGYSVFPLHNAIATKKGIRCSCKLGDTCPSAAKHPRTRNGYKDATTDQAFITKWWTRFPNANIGIVTGEESGVFVLDIDTKNGGHFSLEEMQDYFKLVRQNQYEPFPATLTTITGSGGRHFYFKYLLEFGVKNSSGVLGVGMDVRGDGGYIVAPPSSHLSGTRYKWSGINIPILDAPDWLIYELTLDRNDDSESHSISQTALSRSPNEKVLEGNRQDAFYRYVSGLVNHFSEEEVLRRAIIFNLENLEPPLPEEQVLYQVKYLFRRFGKRGKLDMSLNK